MNSVAPVRSTLPFRFVSSGVADSLRGLCRKTLRRWDVAGTLKPAFRTSGNHRRYDRLHLLAILHRRSTKSAPDAQCPSPEMCSLKAAIYTRVSSS